MGRKSKRKHQHKKQQQIEDLFDDMEEIVNMNLNDFKGRNAKEKSKLKKKEEKKMRRYMKRKCNNKKATSLQTGWQKIVIRGDSPLEKDFILTSIGNYIDTEFQPLGFYKLGFTSGFYLEDNAAAAHAIAGLSKRLQGPDGSRLRISAEKSDSPDLILNADQIQILRECLSRRYDPTTCMLDLSSLHKDPVLIEKDILAPITSAVIMKLIVKIIKENIPQLKALNLSKNNLRRGDILALEGLHNESSQLAAINLEYNKISDLKLLNVLKGFPLSELNLQFNPVVDTYQDKPVSYIKEVRGRLRNLALLDGVDVEIYLVENSKSTHSAPKMNINFSHNEAILCGSSNDSEPGITEENVRTFLDQYYGLVDTPQRANLLAAYTPDAILEVKSSIQLISSSIFVGHEKISEALVLFPPTQHQHNTFSFNIKPLSPRITQAEIIGVCHIAGIDALVGFQRTMNIVPFNTGFCCSQDTLVLKFSGT